MCPNSFDEMLTLSPDLFSSKSTALRLAVYTYIDFVHKIFPWLKLTTGSSEPIRITTEPSSKPKLMMLEFSFETYAAQPIPKLYSNVFKIE